MQKPNQDVQRQNPPTRKTYRKPTLREFGSIRALTQGGLLDYVIEDVYYNTSELN